MPNHKKRKDVSHGPKHGSYCWYFCLNLEYLGWPYRQYIKIAKNGGFCEGLLSENDFEAVSATFCSYDYGANTSEAVLNIATDQKGYRKFSSCVILLLNSQNISMSNSLKSYRSSTKKGAITSLW